MSQTANASGASRADQFMAKHTDLLSHDDPNPPLNTECPVCLEGIEEHVCLKIVHVPGCNHLIGLECLKEFVNDHAHRKKLCPICRNVWLPDEQQNNTPGARSAARVHAMIRANDSEVRRMLEESDRVIRESRQEREIMYRQLQEHHGNPIRHHHRADQQQAEARHQVGNDITAAEDDPILDEIDEVIRNNYRASDRDPDEHLGARARALSTLAPFLSQPPREMRFYERYLPGRSTHPDNRRPSRSRTPPLYPSTRLFPPMELPRTPPGASSGPISPVTERSNRANPPSSARYTDQPSFAGLGTGRDSHIPRPADPSDRIRTSSSRPHRHTRSSRDTAHVPLTSPPATPTHMFNSAALTDLIQRFNALEARLDERRGSGA